MSDTENNYYLLIGTLNSADSNGARSFASLYGKTEIGGGRITTDLIRSSDGTTYFDLKNNVIAGKINFKDGLISNRIWVGTSENTAIAGLGGKNSLNQNMVVWAGKNENGYQYQVFADGTTIWQDEDGLELMSIHPNVGSVDVSMLIAGVITTNRISCSGDIYGKFVTSIPLANNVVAETTSSYALMWSGELNYSNGEYTATPYIRAKVLSSYWGITVGRVGEGQVSVVFSHNFLNINDYIVVGQGKLRGNSAHSYISVQEKSVEHFMVVVADDNTRNDADFYLQIYGKA